MAVQRNMINFLDFFEIIKKIFSDRAKCKILREESWAIPPERAAIDSSCLAFASSSATLLRSEISLMIISSAGFPQDVMVPALTSTGILPPCLHIISAFIGDRIRRTQVPFKIAQLIE